MSLHGCGQPERKAREEIEQEAQRAMHQAHRAASAMVHISTSRAIDWTAKQVQGRSAERAAPSSTWTTRNTPNQISSNPMARKGRIEHRHSQQHHRNPSRAAHDKIKHNSTAKNRNGASRRAPAHPPVRVRCRRNNREIQDLGVDGDEHDHATGQQCVASARPEIPPCGSRDRTTQAMSASRQPKPAASVGVTTPKYMLADHRAAISNVIGAIWPSAGRSAAMNMRCLRRYEARMQPYARHAT